MSQVTETHEQRRLLVFPSPSAFVGFVLTFLEEHELGAQSEIYQNCLNRIFVPRRGKQKLYLSVRGDEQLIEQITCMAIANGGEAREFHPLDSSKCHVLPISKLIRAVRLQPAVMDCAKLDHVLVAMWRTDAGNLAEFLRTVWNLGISEVEVAFVGARGKSRPRHFVKLFGIRHSDAFQAWCGNLDMQVELYAPVRSDRRGSRFYSLWGYRHPVPGLETLAELDRELVLLRPRAEGDSHVTEWVTFAAGEVNFFRKAHQFTELQVSLDDVPLIELQEDKEPVSAPMELAIVNKPRSGPNRIWQLDKQIDRQRRTLQEMEQLRARLAAGEQEEVFFAYRFDQEGQDELNSRLIRLMQQRLGTLANYDYAFCHPRKGTPYHLVIANRSQRQLGFSLQPADHVYFQPSSWRRWGLNLFLPLHAELAPRIDGNDALSMLQKILERSDEAGAVDTQVESVMENAAILWEPGRDGEILETRIRETKPLLEEFHLLNSFQRKFAGRVADATRAKLSESFREARHRIESELDGLTRDLLQHVGERTERLETNYGELEKALKSAEKLVGVAEPRVEEVKQLILNLPDQWIRFVNRVIEIHRSIADPEIEGIVQLRNRLQVGREDLRALAATGRDLSAAARKHQERFQKRLAECEETIQESTNIDQELETLAHRAGRVFNEVNAMHNRLKARIQRVQAMQKRVVKLQTEIDEVDSRETNAKQRLKELEPLHAEKRRLAVKVKKMEQEIAGSEQELQQKTAELSRSKQEIKDRCLQIAQRLNVVENYLQTDARRAEELDQASALLQEQLDLVDAHKDAVGMWEQQKQGWETYIDGQRNETARRMDKVKQSLNDLENADQMSQVAQDHVREAREHLLLAETIVRNNGN